MKLVNHIFTTPFLLFITLAAAIISNAQSKPDDDDYLSPVRPTVSDSGKIQKKGVLQVEYGVDADFRASDYTNSQTTPLGIYLAVSNRLRLDAEIETVASQKMLNRETGIGDVSLGFKALLRTDPEKRLAVGFSYDAKLPAADEKKGLGSGRIDHTARLILDRTYGKNDFIANFGYLNVGREDSSRRASGAQLVLAYERELPKNFGAQFELIGNSVDEARPRGIYFLSALTYKIGKRFVLDFGARPGFGADAPKFNLFGGITVGAGNLFKK